MTRDPFIYDRVVERQGLGESHNKILGLIGYEKKVLEVGPAGGYLTQELTERLRCLVDAVELNPIAASSASRYARRVIVGSIEDPAVVQQLDADYDVAVFSDVLEHLIAPGETLRRVGERIRTGGRVVASIPNVAHWTVRLALLLGRFEYTSTGILDDTHLRFFTRATTLSLFEHAGYREIRTDVTLGPIPFEHGLRSERVRQLLLRAFPDLFGFQFIIEASR